MNNPITWYLEIKDQKLATAYLKDKKKRFVFITIVLLLINAGFYIQRIFEPDVVPIRTPVVIAAITFSGSTLVILFFSIWHIWPLHFFGVLIYVNFLLLYVGSVKDNA